MKNAPLLHRLEYGAFVPFRWLLRSLPESAGRALGRFLGGLFYTVSGSRRKTALGNLEIAFPEFDADQRRRVARQSFRGFGDALLSTLASSNLSGEDFEKRWVVEGWENFSRVAERGRGLILLSAHIGTWEIAAYPAPLRGYPTHAIGRPPDNPYLLEEMVAMRCRFGNQMIAKKGAARAMLRRLREGGTVGILIDQRAKLREGELLPFFGQPARTSTLVARMSRKTGAAVVPVFSWRLDDGRWLVRYGEPVEPFEVEPHRGDADCVDPEGVAMERCDAAPCEEAAVMALTQRYLDVTEAVIREQPQRWLWMHDRWRIETETC
ncbi:MAG: lysophospholipid acyltransferase family protein [Acidobacteriota bacterium]